MLINYAAITHQGRVRRNNEDAYLVSALDGDEPLVNGLPRVQKHCTAGLLAAVADGMGGAAAGEIASREGLAALSVNLFSRWGILPAEQRKEGTLWHALRDATESSSAAVLRYSDQERSARGMGSTLTAALIWEGAVYIAQIGDSRAYVLRQDQLVQLTRDQTLVNDMLESGILRPDQVHTHPQRSMITQALGAPMVLKTALGRLPLRRGDRLLLCSDGLHGELEHETLQGLLAQRLSPKETLKRLLGLALESGGRDNITAVFLALDDPAFPLPGRKDVAALQPPPPQIFQEPRPGLLSRISHKLAGKP